MRILRFIFKSRRRSALMVLLALILIPVMWTGIKLARSPHSSIWSGPYFRELLSGRYNRADETTDMFFIMCDHWEPGKGQPAVVRSKEWLQHYRSVVASHTDSNGRIFQYTWYYPIDNMDTEILGLLASAASEGLGEIEVHWHHNHDSSEQFTVDLVAALPKFTKVGALVGQPGDKPRWSFIHGNWALDGSSPGQCGVNNEISILQEHGCYADFTFPALEASGQPVTINQIYYAEDTPEPKSHNTGIEAQVGSQGKGLMIFQGPLGMDFRNPLLLIEGAAIDGGEGTGFVGKLRPPATFRDYFKASRIALWDDIHVSVAGKPEWCFVKVHAHGHEDADILLGGELDALLDEVEDYCKKKQVRLHYITAREACNLVWAAEKGLSGNPSEYYDLVIPQPMNRKLPKPGTLNGN